MGGDREGASTSRSAALTRLGEIAPMALLGHVLDTMPSGVFTVDPRGASTARTVA